jgi:transforming growth factor-beta-induced protein
MKTKLFLILPLVALFAFTGCNEDDSVMESQYKRGQGVDFNNKPGDKTILEIVENSIQTSGEFSSLAAAIGYVDDELDAGLGAAISSNDLQLTVFAPTNAAFGGLLAALEEELGLSPGSLGLTDIPAPIVLTVLQYHLTDGRRASNSVVPPNDRNTKTIETFLEGASFEVAKGTPPMILAGGNTANIINPNLSASNGIIHVIDEVILPIPIEDVVALLP